MNVLVVLLNFLISLIVSGVLIYFVTKLLGEGGSIGTAIMAALAGTIIYTIVYSFLGTGILAAVLGGIVWLIALGKLYGIGWGKSLLIAFLLWIVISVLSFLPTVFGPL